MLKALIKKQLIELLPQLFVDRKNKKMRSKASVAGAVGLALLIFVGLGSSFYTVAMGLVGVILGNGFDWLYFSIEGLLALALGVFGSVFTTYASLYMPKDNDLLLSLPIPPKKLLLARLTGVFIMSLIYSTLIWLPASLVYWINVSFNVISILRFLLILLVITTVVTVLSCVLGFFVAIIAKKAKGKSFLTLFFSLAIMVLYYVVYFKILNSLTDILENINKIGATVKNRLHFAYLLGNAADGDVFSILVLVAVTVSVSAICLFVLSKTFLSLASENGNAEKKTKKAFNFALKNSKKALILREFKHFCSLPMWMLNGGFGLLVMPIMGVVLLIKGDFLIERLSLLGEYAPWVQTALPVIFAMFACLVISTDNILPVSVSIEGKSLWILQSLPVKAFDVLKAKEKMGTYITVIPAVFFVITGSIAFDFKLIEIITICLTVLIFIWFIADFGLFLNLKMPNFTWTNETALVKQSVNVLISLFGGWLFCLLVGAGGAYLCGLLNPEYVLLVVAVAFAIMRTLLYRWIKNTGTVIFENL